MRTGSPARRSPRFRTIDHTADIGLLVRGLSLPELFANAAAGTFYLLYPGLREGAGDVDLKFELSESNMEELLVAWLRELLYVHESRRTYLSAFEVALSDGPSLSARCRSRPAGADSLRFEIKLVTYHGLKIERTGNGYRARIIFDV